MAEDSLYAQLEALFTTEQYAITAEVKKTMRKAANKAKSRIKQDAPRRKGGKEEYAKGWVAETEHESAVDLSIVVRDKAKPTLPHLLENPHRIIVPSKSGNGYVMRDTGRMTKPHPHIVANAEEEIEAFWNELMQGGGSK